MVLIAVVIISCISSNSSGSSRSSSSSRSGTYVSFLPYGFNVLALESRERRENPHSRNNI